MERYRDYLVDTETQRIYNLDGSEVTYHMVCGYLCFSIKNTRVHRVIAFLCVPNDDPERKQDVHHIDGNKLNNSPDNLVWMSRSEHQRYHALNRSEDTIKKLRMAATGYVHTKESREKMSRSRMGHPVSQSTREKIGKANSGARNGMYGHKYTQEEIDRIARAQTKPVVMISESGDVLSFFRLGAKEAANVVGADKNSIAGCCLGRTKTCKGHKFRYATKEEIDEYNY